MKRLRPLYVSVPAVILFVVWCWFGMASIDYSGGPPLLALQTAGWFALGFPFIIGMSCLLAWFTVAMYGRFGVKALVAIWLALLTCVCVSIRESLPQQRLARIIGAELAQDVKILRLISSDSFGDGTFTLGEIAGTSELLEQIVEYRSLLEKEIVPATQFGPLIEDTGDYRSQTAYGDSRSTFFLSPDTGTIVFRYSSDAPPTE
ncbi:MAG: hypothetical protein KDB27_09115 [Planctomycetales bacterium]|nr:hypothetical protein [Planctomycetales bacterium]